MATTHDMRYERDNAGEDTRRSAWSWLLPLAIILLAAIALASYLANRNIDTTNGANSINGTTNSSLETDLNTQ